MNAVSFDIKDLFESSSYAIADFNVDMFIGLMPDLPNDCICLYDMAGESMEKDIDMPHLMIHCRSSVGGYTTAFAKAMEIRDYLHGLSGISINDTWYVGIWHLSGPFFIGYDDKKRPIFSINFRINRS